MHTPSKYWLFFYGWPNIFGMAAVVIAALADVLIIKFTSISFWLALLLVPLFYIAGWLLGTIMQPPDAQLRFNQHLTEEQITQQLDKLLKQVKNRISPEAYAHLQNIQQSVLTVLPQMASGRFGNQDLFTIKKTVFDYLPTTLENYLKLPSMYANHHIIQDGKTASTLLNEQLTLIDTTMQQVVHNIYNEDAQALLVNERFLQQRLEQESFL